MKLPDFESELATNLQEFDIWITPSLGEIRDTERYQQELTTLVSGFETLKAATKDFANEESCRPEQLILELQQTIQNLPSSEVVEILSTIISVFYLVTGKTDNNTKCQFPLFLRDHAFVNEIPTARRGKLASIPLPRVLKAGRLVKLVASLHDYPQQQSTLLQRFVEFILSDEAYISQLWSIGHSYVALQTIGKGADLLSPLAIFKVRGSVMASGGHTPENILRRRLTEWGLQPGKDFNEADVAIEQLFSLHQESSNRKTRAYDFVLPYQSWQVGSKLLIQCQFYAGDSGSVSHKNVDQTRSTRDATKETFPEVVFVEYVDGAGYFASLNGDLRSLSAMPDTASFFQVRTAAIRLRRELQKIGFLTPLEIEHSIIRVGKRREHVCKSLAKEGYAESEINRCLSQAFEHGVLLQPTPDQIEIHPERKSISRRYLLLDMAAIHGELLAVTDIPGKLLVPGYGPFYGLRQNDLVRLTMQEVSNIASEWQDPTVAFDDLQWLIDQRFMTSVS